MSMTDMAWMAMVLAGTGWLLYRSLWKKKGQCHGCGGGGCCGKN